MLSVLVVDDEPLISLDVFEILTEAGYSIIGPVSSLTDALFLIDQSNSSIALIDIRTRNEFCSSLAHQLRLRNIPFVIHTGYRRDDADDIEFRDAPRLEKPASPTALLTLLSQLSALSTQERPSAATSDETASRQAGMSVTIR